MLYTLLGTRNGKRGEVNAGGYSNPALDELIDQIGVETDQAKRNAMIDQTIQILQKDVRDDSAASAGHRLGGEEQRRRGAAGGQLLSLSVCSSEVTGQ